jgi:hypothetical protein
MREVSDGGHSNTDIFIYRAERLLALLDTELAKPMSAARRRQAEADRAAVVEHLAKFRAAKRHGHAL